jgi:tetratricopeptide (TPR) repeat protein
MATRSASVAARAPAVKGPSPAEQAKSKQFAGAVQAYEQAIKLMHGEDYERARKCFEKLVSDYPDEPEIQARAKMLIHACELKLHEHARTVLRSADDHYNVGVADLNRRELQSAIQHLQQALKLMPRADHVLYALAAANALQGNRDQALTYLKQSIHHRAENRFLAARDNDFATLVEDSDFKQIVTAPEK